MTERLVDVKPTPHGPEPGAASVLNVRRALSALVIVAILFAIRATAPRPIELTDALQDFITLSISVLIESLPFVMLGIGLSVVVQLLGTSTGAFPHASTNADSAARWPVPPWRVAPGL